MSWKIILSLTKEQGGPLNSNGQHPPPYSEEAERGLISSMLLAPGKVAALIEPEAFFIEAHRILFNAICHWTLPEKRVDFIWLKTELERTRQLEDVGGGQALSGLFDFVPAPDNADFYAQIVQESFAKRQLIAVCQEAISQCRNRGADPSLLVKETLSRIEQIAITPGGAQQKNFIKVLTPSQIRQYQPPKDLVLVGDNHFVRGDVTILGGAPGVGKSRVLVALAQSGATKKQWLGYTVQTQFRTLIIQNENGLLRLQRELADIDEPSLEEYLRISEPPRYGMCFWKPQFRDQLRQVYDSFGPQLVGLDPWNAVARDEKARDYLESFDIIRDVFQPGDAGPSLVIVAHTRKPMPGERANGRALLNLLAGSYVLASVPRTVFILQHASDDVQEDRVVVTCTKNNNGELGPRAAWVRKNGLFAPAQDFDWEQWDGGESDSTKGRVFTPQKVAEILKEFPQGLPKAKLAKEIKNHGVDLATGYRAVDRAKAAGTIKFKTGTDVYVAQEQVF